VSRPLVADTGPLYAAVDPGDQFHTRAQRELNQIQRQGREVIVTFSTLLEAYTLVLYRLGNSSASRWLSEITAGTALINPEPDDYWEAQARVLSLADQAITLFDATVATIAIRIKAEVWTYDHHFDVFGVPVWR